MPGVEKMYNRGLLEVNVDFFHSWAFEKVCISSQHRCQCRKVMIAKCVL
jgi:hypothetical protein